MLSCIRVLFLFLTHVVLLRNGEAAEVAIDAADQSDPQSHEPIFTVIPTYFDTSGAPYAWDNVMRIQPDPETGQGQMAVNTLEIGCFEGAASRFMLQKWLSHKDSRLTCIDTFQGSPEHLAAGMTESIDGLYERYLHNIAPWRHKVTILRGSSRDMLKLPQVVAQKFDFIYVDADHRSRHVLEDGILAFPLLKMQGVMVFDDYWWHDEGESALSLEAPKQGIDTFLNMFQEFYTFTLVGFFWQVGIVKTKELS